MNQIKLNKFEIEEFKLKLNLLAWIIFLTSVEFVIKGIW